MTGDFEGCQFDTVYSTLILTHKQLETHGCILNIVGTDALMLKQLSISTHSAD